MKIYTVAGYYEDNDQRYCTSVEAEDPLAAEAQVTEREPGVVVVATFEGELDPVDGQTYCYAGGPHTTADDEAFDTDDFNDD